MPGIITIAIGKKRYIDMAKMLALSLMKNAPDIPRAIITDVAAEEFKGLFNICIPYNPSYGDGFSQKLHLDKYSPFDETIFIDADCLAITPLDSMINLFKPHSFMVFGDQISSGEWFMDVSEVCKKFNVPSLPLFNGGVYCFKKNDVTTNIFNKAREIKDRYFDIGIQNFRGTLADEPLIAIAMALNNVEAVEDGGIAMRTPIGIEGPLNVDVLGQYCHFSKEGIQVKPAILHFSGSNANAFHYKRECAKLKLSVHLPFLSRKFVSLLINLIYNTWYTIWVFCKRVLKVIIRKEKFDFKNHLPVFSNH
jgi:hypothetical protein